MFLEVYIDNELCQQSIIYYTPLYTLARQILDSVQVKQMTLINTFAICVLKVYI